jgi:thiol:disulfide interchange protein
VALAIWPNYGEAPQGAAKTASAEGSVPYEAYSPERLAALRAEGKPVFVNFTAAWCVTCQVNEKVALSRKNVADAFARTGAVYLKADWTRKDAAIEAELAKHGRAGVPLYLVYAAQGGEGVILPQILTEGLIVQALEDAAPRSAPGPGR